MLSSWNTSVLSQAFGVGRSQIGADVVLVATSRGAPLDELITMLRERHNWSAAEAYRYLRTLHLALRGGPISL